MIKKIVFLDRDGVINRLVERNGEMVSPRTFMDFEILPGVSEAIGRLKKHGFQIVVVTNQPDISRGLMKVEELRLMHQLVQALGVEEIRVCPHSDHDNCECRKPKPGLLTRYIEESSSHGSVLWMVGDQPRDWQAGEAVGAKVVRIIGKKYQDQFKDGYCSDNLLDAVKKLVVFS